MGTSELDILSYSEELILIAGGYDKNLDYTPIAKPILDKVKVSRLSFVILWFDCIKNLKYSTAQA